MIASWSLIVFHGTLLLKENINDLSIFQFCQVHLGNVAFKVEHSEHNLP